MSHVKGVREVSQKFANACFCLTVNNTARSKVNDDRENNDDAEGLIHAIHPQVIGAPDPRHKQNCR